MSKTQSVSEASGLIQAAQEALLHGHTYEASKLFRRATELEPENADAWVGLADAVRSFREKQQHLQRALELDPNNEEAQASLSLVEAKLASGELLAPRTNTQNRTVPEQVSETLTEVAPVTDSTDGAEAPASEVTTLYCYRHPDRETGLQCTQCGRPICHECVNTALVGQLCPECTRERRPVNYQVSTKTLVLAGFLTLLLTLGLGFLFRIVSFGFLGFFLAFILGPLAGELMVRVLDRLTRAKRGKSVQLTVGSCGFLGFLPWTVDLYLRGGLYSMLTLVFFAVLVVMTAMRRMR